MTRQEIENKIRSIFLNTTEVKLDNIDKNRKIWNQELLYEDDIRSFIRGIDKEFGTNLIEDTQIDEYNVSVNDLITAIEQKVNINYEKKYKEVLDCIKMIYDSCKYLQVPERKEIHISYSADEDEKIRKEIIENIRQDMELECTLSEEKGKWWIAWLEKQGNQRKQLINKACNVLVNCIEDFMCRRMEIWDEECKKQTLENIRKKLEE